MDLRLLSLDELETTCQARWRSGALAACREAAQLLLERAEHADDALMQLRAQIHLSRSALQLSQPTQAWLAARCGVVLCRIEGCLEEEVEALSLACSALTHLHRCDEALTDGAMALALAEQSCMPLAPIQAADVLGLAQAWSGQLDEALTTFAMGAARAHSIGRADWQAHLAIHAASAVAWALLRGDPQTQDGARLTDRLAQLVEAATTLCEINPGVSGPQILRPGRFLLGWAQVLLWCWNGEVAAARRLLPQIGLLAPAANGWLAALLPLATAELAFAQGDPVLADAANRQALGLAEEASHLALADAVDAQRVRLLAHQGRFEEALRAERSRGHRLGQAREQQADLRRRTAQAAVEVLNRGMLAAATAVRPAEDALTGLADRHHFVQRVEALMQRTDVERARCSLIKVALVDAADIVARHGPLARDRAMCALAALLRQLLRGADLPARWTADEFAILVHRSGPEESRRVCARIEAAVSQYHWSVLAPGLLVKVVTAWAPTRSGDTVAQAMRRCDDALHAGERERLEAA